MALLEAQFFKNVRNIVMVASNRKGMKGKGTAAKMLSNKAM